MRDSGTSKIEISNAYNEYQIALHGPAWKFQQAMTDANTRTNVANPDDLRSQIVKLEHALEQLDGRETELLEQEKELDVQIFQGHQLVQTARRATELKTQYGR